MATFGLTSTGLNLPRGADFIARVQARYEELTGEEPDWDNDLVIQSFLIAVADEFDGLSEALHSIYDNWDENNATGAQLENIAAISPGITKLPATFSQVTLTLGGDAGEVVPSGSIAETDDGVRWVTTEDATIEAGGTVDVVARAETVGAVAAGAGTITNITTPVEGWDIVTNAVKASVGHAAETDGEFRTRRRLSMQIAGGNSLGALLGAVLALPFITDAVAIQNDTALTSIVEGVELPASSFAIVVLPVDLTTEQRTTLVQVIYALAPIGIESFGTETATASRIDGAAKTIAFSFPTSQNVSTQATYAIGAGFDASTVATLVDAAIDDYFDDLGPGDPVRRLAAIRAVSTAVAGLVHFDIYFDGDTTGVDVFPAATKVAVRTTTGSTLTQVT